jgi:hypothetical protein
MIGDEELDLLLAPSRQPYTGEVVNRDPISRNLPLLGQLNPVESRRLAAEHGRFLSGFGETTMPTMHDEEQISDHADVSDMEQQDDVLGSGVFDPSGRPATVNPDLGVFAAHYSIPGNHAREVPFTVNREITDITSGAEVVGIPSGGLNYVEHGDAIPYLNPTDRYQPYAKPGVGGKGWDPDSTFAPAESFNLEPKPTSRGGSLIPFCEDPKLGARRSNMTGIPGRPARDPMFQTSEVPGWPSSQLAPMKPSETKVPQTPQVTPPSMLVAAATEDYSVSMPAFPYMGDPMVSAAPSLDLQAYSMGMPRPAGANLPIAKHPAGANLPIAKHPEGVQFMPSRAPLAMAVGPRQLPQVTRRYASSSASAYNRPQRFTAASGFGDDTDSSNIGTYVALGIAGVAAGVAIRMLWPKKGG